MDRDGLVAMIESYAKRSDLTTEIETYFIPNGEARIGRELRAEENRESATNTQASNEWTIAETDFAAIDNLEYSTSGEWVTLVEHDIATINFYTRGAGAPEVFTVRPEKVIEVRPWTAGDYRMTYYSAPVLASGSSENDVLTRFPNMYMLAALVELRIWEERPLQIIEATEAAFMMEVKRINKAARAARTSKPAMRRL